MTSPSPLYCIAYGVPMRITADTPALFAEVFALLPFGTEITSNVNCAAQSFSLSSCGETLRFRCCEGTDVIFESRDLVSVCDALRRVLMVHVANHADGYVFVHAGVVALNGKVLVLPGKSFAGKSTLTAALVRAGATYYSDEYAILDDEGLVHPYARNLSMRKPGETLQLSVPISDLGGSTGVGRSSVSMIAFTQYEKGAEWSARSISHGLALLEMLKHSISVQRTPTRVMGTLAAMLRNATAWTSSRGEADVTAAALLAALSNPNADSVFTQSYE
jgi:hypothetical protein